MSNVLEQALEALESIIFNKPYDGKFSDVLASIKEAIKQQGEQVAYAHVNNLGEIADVNILPGQLYKSDYRNGWKELPLCLCTSAPTIPDVDWLANVIRSVDGNHTLGAGALAEKIVDALSAAPKGE